MDIQKLITVGQQFLPAADVILTMMTEPQRKWMLENNVHLVPYLQSKTGQEALHLFLHEFADFVISVQKAGEKGVEKKIEAVKA